MSHPFEASPVHEQHERSYTGSVVHQPSTLEEWPLGEGDITHPVLAAIVDAVRIARRTRPRVTLPSIKRALELEYAKLAPVAFEILDRGDLSLEHDLEPVVESLRERGACRRATRAAQMILDAARAGRWSDTQQAIASAATVRADGANRNRIYSAAEAMEMVHSPKSKPLARVIPFERKLNPFIRLSPKTRVVLGASTNVGKTSLVARWARTSTSSGVPSAVITVEDPVEQIGAKWLSENAAVNSVRLVDGELTQPERERAERAIDEAKGAKLWIVHVEDRSLEGVLSAMRALAALGVKMVAIDYLQAIRGDRVLKSAKERLDHNLNEIIAVGNVSDLALVLVSQLSRQEKGSFRPPTMADLKESGDIENAATWVVMAYRERESSDAPVIVRVAKVKDRGGIGFKCAFRRNDLGVLEECDVPVKGVKSGKRKADDWSGADDFGGDEYGHG